MLLIAFFTDNGTPKTGLTPTIDVWESDGTQSVTSQSMTEIAGGFYKYDFTSYDDTKDYCIRADGGASLSAVDRYVYSTNESDAVTTDLPTAGEVADAIWDETGADHNTIGTFGNWIHKILWKSK